MNSKMNHAIALTLMLTIIVGPASVTSAHLITEAKGEVKLKKSGSSDYRPTGTGAKLDKGDLLYPEPAAKVKVLCNNYSIWRVPSGQPSGVNQGCPSQQDVATIRRAELVPRPGGNKLEIPYILSPRMTYLLNNRPTLRWNGVAGGTHYTVRLQGPGGLEWQTEVSSTEVVYPDDASPLTPRVRYLLTVKADNDRSSLEDGGANLGFELLEENEIKSVQRKAAIISASAELNEEEKKLALAELYSDQSLHADAIAILEGLVKKGSQTAIVYLRLGDLYAGTGLNLLAEARYSKAIALLQSQVQSGLKEAQDKMSMLRLNGDGTPSVDQILTPSD